MRVFYFELKKAVWFLPLWILLAVFLVFDFCVIYSDVGDADFHREICKVHEVICGNVHEGKVYDLYLEYKEQRAGSYEDLDMQDIKDMKEGMLKYAPKGGYAGFINGNYEKLQRRVEHIKADGDTGGDFYPGDVFGIHGKISSLLRLCIIEMLVMMCLSTLHIMDFERINQTEGLVFPSWMGRRNLWIKFGAGIVGGLSFSVAILTMSLGEFLAFVPMSGLWDTPVSSYMVMESNGFWEYPFITFVRLNIRQELTLKVITGILMALLFGLIAGALQLLVNNSYITMLCIAAAFIGLLGLPIAIRSAGWLNTAVCLTPSTMWYYCSRWYIENDPFLSFAWSEFLTLGIWFAVTIIALLYGNRFVLKKDIL